MNKKLLGVGLILVVGIGILWKQGLPEQAWMRNQAMLAFEQAVLRNRPIDWTNTIESFQIALSLNPEDTYLQARLNNAKLRLGTATPAVFAPIQGDPCVANSDGFVRLIREWKDGQMPYTGFGGGHRVWNFDKSNAMAQATLQFIPVGSECWVQMKINFEPTPNRFVNFSRALRVDGDMTYVLAAEFMSPKNSRTWIGIGSLWIGAEVPPSQNWEGVKFTFRTSADQRIETVIVIVEGGEGVIAIRNVSVKRLV